MGLFKSGSYCTTSPDELYRPQKISREPWTLCSLQPSTAEPPVKAVFFSIGHAGTKSSINTLKVYLGHHLCWRNELYRTAVIPNSRHGGGVRLARGAHWAGTFATIPFAILPQFSFFTALTAIRIQRCGAMCRPIRLLESFSKIPFFNGRREMCKWGRGLQFSE